MLQLNNTFLSVYSLQSTLFLVAASLLFCQNIHGTEANRDIKSLLEQKVEEINEKIEERDGYASENTIGLICLNGSPIQYECHDESMIMRKMHYLGLHGIKKIGEIIHDARGKKDKNKKTISYDELSHILKNHFLLETFQEIPNITISIGKSFRFKNEMAFNEVCWSTLAETKDGFIDYKDSLPHAAHWDPRECGGYDRFEFMILINHIAKGSSKSSKHNSHQSRKSSKVKSNQSPDSPENTLDKSKKRRERKKKKNSIFSKVYGFFSK